VRERVDEQWEHYTLAVANANLGFSAEDGDKGPQASSVQIVSKPGSREESLAG